MRNASATIVLSLAMFRPWFMLFFLVLYLNAPLAKAQLLNGTISDSFAGAGRGAVDPLETGFLNPAGVAHLSKYYAGLNWSDRSHDRLNDMSRLQIGLADGLEGGVFPAAFHYARTEIRRFGGTSATQDQFHLAVADRILDTAITVGLGFTYQMHRDDTFGRDETYNVDMGFLWVVNPEVGLGIVGYNLIGREREGPAPETLLRRSVAAGMNWIIDPLLTVRLDYQMFLEDNENYQGAVMGGFESTLPMDFLMRAGFGQDGFTREGLWSLGLGWKGPRLRIDYVFQNHYWPKEGVRHGVDLWLHF